MATYYNSHLVLSAVSGPTKNSTALDSPGGPVTTWVETGARESAGDTVSITVDARPHASVAWQTIAYLSMDDFQDRGWAKVTTAFYPFIRVEVHTITSSSPTTSAVVTEIIKT